jgi:hypothetical protein
MPDFTMFHFLSEKSMNHAKRWTRRPHPSRFNDYLRLGYLLNFGEALLKDGMVRAVHRLPEAGNIHV